MKPPLLIALTFWAAITSSLAHSGGTDGQGGHKGSVGEYHFHHGFLAHAHTDGLCPYIPPQPPQEVVADLYAGMTISGQVGDSFSVEASDGEGDWQVIATLLELSTAEMAWIDTDPTNRSKRFYRTVIADASGAALPHHLAPRIYPGFQITGRVGQMIAVEAREASGEDWKEVERFSLPRSLTIWLDERRLQRKQSYRTIVLYTPPKT